MLSWAVLGCIPSLENKHLRLQLCFSDSVLHPSGGMGDRKLP